ncbi:hypothetical protein OKW21_000542 [Catalinimonas alkaloidigena]|uniref:hypothetical protein n=1 Tax=Catalinimonas alkaloidigena TaxID=1075417 RepID=UPI002405F55F|nr:hypothetical protein [Catalinimonas alkaloidigena]MDF9795279.1 hypothetical protein [Catalinimonas alkaloidigena]
MNLRYTLYVVITLLITANSAFAQSDMIKEAITYEELYDDPYAINKLFVHLQPLYTELFATNVNAGFGLGANYLHKDKADFFANFRHAYSRSTDFVRNIAYKNSSVANKPNSFTYMELGGTYHVRDEETDTETKMILYSKRYQKGNRWASHVPEHTIIPSKVRKVVGARLGAFAYATSIDLKRVAQEQEVVIEDEFGTFPADLYSHTNQSVTGAFVGGSMSWIKNMAIKPDKGYGVLSDDLLLTTFLDFMFAPSITIEDIQYRDPVSGDMRTFSTQELETKKVGFRLGIEGKYNRELSWAYGAEIGARPTVNGKGFFALIKISLPVYSTNLDYGREAFGK